MAERTPGAAPIDQATLEKWETGKSAVRVEDLQLLAEVYGVTADRLFFPPGDQLTPAQIMRAFQIIATRDPRLIEGWLDLGEGLRPRDPDRNEGGRTEGGRNGAPPGNGDNPAPNGA